MGGPAFVSPLAQILLWGCLYLAFMGCDSSAGALDPAFEELVLDFAHFETLC